MADYFNYKGYKGSVLTSIEDECLYGKILFIRDDVLYHADTVPELLEAFKEAVDQYLADCAEMGREPNKACSGSFNIRVGAERHQALEETSYRCDKSINAIVNEAIDLYLDTHKYALHSPAITTSYSVTSTPTSASWKTTPPNLRVVK